MGAAPSQSEGDVNSTPRRAAWQREHLDEASRALLARDSATFLHQSVSTPCLAPIVRAEGLYIEDMAGRRYMDFHGNNVHHLGHGHPEVIAAIKRQLDELSFAPRRFAPLRAVELAESLGERFRALTGNIVFPGFTAPKLAWVRNNEPETFAKVAKVLLPKDFLRLWLTGEYLSDMSDSAGTSWLDTGKRAWSNELLAATGLTIEQMPGLVEGHGCQERLLAHGQTSELSRSPLQASAWNRLWPSM